VALSPPTLTSAAAVKRGGVSTMLRDALVAMRPWQWTKNLFVFPPLVFGGRMLETEPLLQTCLAFVALVAVTSAVYLVNDVMDVESDRTHPKKAKRPVASGSMPIPLALAQAAVLAAAGLAMARYLGGEALVLLAAYLALFLSYTLVLKTILFVDCITIAIGFVLRVLLGSVTADVTPSHWLLICTFCLALFLAFSKRRSEAIRLPGGASVRRAVLTDYSDLALLDQVNTILLGATLTSYMLYTVAPETVEYYGGDNLVYGTVFVMYGLLRYLYLMRRGVETEDIALVPLTDHPMLITIFSWAVYSVAVVYLFGRA
jgi:4-hydroxybenzoate polyprenyltransferase